MKKILLLSILATMFIASDSFGQSVNWANWAPLEGNDGIDAEYRMGNYTSYDGQLHTNLQIKVYNTRHKKVMVDFKKVTFSNGDTDGGYLLGANQDSYTFEFRTKGSADSFTTHWTVEYYER